MKFIFSRVPYYVPLFGIYILTLYTFLNFSYDTVFQKSAVIAAGFAHVSWGIIYHYIHKDLSSILVLEYIAIAALGIASVLTIL